MKKPILLLIALYISISLSGQTKIDSLIQLGISYHDAGDYAKAIEFYKQALTLDPENSTANYEIAYSYMMAKDYENSVKYSDIVINLDNRNALNAYITKGSALDYLGRTDESIKVFEKAIRKFGDNHLLYYNLGYDYYFIKEYEKAEKAFTNAINTKSNHPGSHLLLAQLKADQNRNVQSLLGLYYFLFLEPNSDRSKTAMKLLEQQFGGNVQKDKDKPNQINITLDADQVDGEYGAAGIMLSMMEAARSTDLKKDKTEEQLFIENTTSFFKILGELKDKKKKGLWWDFYVPFFYDLAKSDHMDTFCYYITQSTRESSRDWLEKNNPKIVMFDQWLKDK